MDRLFTVLPFLAAFFIAVAAMPTNVIAVNAKQMGHEHTQPWRSKALTAITRECRTQLLRFKDTCASILGHPLATPALAGAAMLAAAFLDSSYAALGIVPIIGKVDIKALEQVEKDCNAEIDAINTAITKDKRAMTDEERAKFVAAKQRKTDNADLLVDARQRERDELTAAATVDPDTETVTREAATHDIRFGKNRAEEDKTRGFKSVVEFARSVREACIPGSGNIDKRLLAGPIQANAPTSVHTSTGTSGEGYEVPAEFRETIFELAFPGDDLVSRVNPEPTDRSAVDIEADETTPWGSAGVQAKWRAENTQMTPTKTDTKLRTVRLQELYAFVNAADELLEDGPRLQNRLTVKSAAAIQFKAAKAIVEGTGAGQPLGWMKAPCLITILKESGQAAATIKPENVLKMYGRLLADGGSPFWLANRNALPQIATMTIGNQPIWTPPVAGMKEAPQGMLLGLPIVWSEHAETLGTKGDLQLVNPSGYYAAVKRGQGIQFASSIHLFFDYGVSAFRWTFRIGGQPFLSAAVTANKGDSKSHFVCIETRA